MIQHVCHIFKACIDRMSSMKHITQRKFSDDWNDTDTRLALLLSHSSQRIHRDHRKKISSYRLSRERIRLLEQQSIWALYSKFSSGTAKCCKRYGSGAGLHWVR